MRTINLLLCVSLSAIVALNACTKPQYDDTVVKGDPPPVPGGYTNSSQVASSNLLAYWSFDGTNNETKSNTTPVAVSNSSFIPSFKGQALHLNTGFLLFPTITALSSKDALASCSVSMWINDVANNGSTFSEFFTLARDTTKETDWLDIINMGIETGHSASSPIDFHTWVGSYPAGNRAGGDNINDYGTKGVDYQEVANIGKWTHYVMRYDATTENIDLFANNTRVSNNNFRNRKGLGPIVMPTPTQVVIGGFSNVSTRFSKSPTLSFHGLLNGSIDELRVYNKALTDAEISALYQLERQAR